MMADFLTRLAERTLGHAPVAQPIVASMFAPGQLMEGVPVEGEPSETLEETQEVDSMQRSPMQRRDGQQQQHGVAGTSSRVSFPALQVGQPLSLGVAQPHPLAAEAQQSLPSSSLLRPDSVTVVPQQRHLEGAMVEQASASKIPVRRNEKANVETPVASDASSLPSVRRTAPSSTEHPTEAGKHLSDEASLHREMSLSQHRNDVNAEASTLEEMQVAAPIQYSPVRQQAAAEETSLHLELTAQDAQRVLPQLVAQPRPFVEETDQLSRSAEQLPRQSQNVGAVPQQHQSAAGSMNDENFGRGPGRSGEQPSDTTGAKEGVQVVQGQPHVLAHALPADDVAMEGVQVVQGQPLATTPLEHPGPSEHPSLKRMQSANELHRAQQEQSIAARASGEYRGRGHSASPAQSALLEETTLQLIPAGSISLVKSRADTGLSPVTRAALEDGSLAVAALGEGQFGAAAPARAQTAQPGLIAAREDQHSIATSNSEEINRSVPHRQIAGSGQLFAPEGQPSRRQQNTVYRHQAAATPARAEHIAGLDKDGSQRMLFLEQGNQAAAPAQQRSINSAAEQMAAEPTVHVTIGRIDVRAVPTPAPPEPRRPGRSGPALSLDEYLKQRSGGRER